MSKKSETLLEFPCKFPIKIMGDHDAGLEDFVQDTLKKHLKNSKDVELNARHSRDKNYVSITAMITVESKAQLDTLYQAFSEHPNVKMVL